MKKLLALLTLLIFNSPSLIALRTVLKIKNSTDKEIMFVMKDHTRFFNRYNARKMKPGETVLFAKFQWFKTPIFNGPIRFALVDDLEKDKYYYYQTPEAGKAQDLKSYFFPSKLIDPFFRTLEIKEGKENNYVIRQVWPLQTETLRKGPWIPMEKKKAYKMPEIDIPAGEW